MNLGYAQGHQLAEQLEQLADYPVDELFSDGNQEVEALHSPTSEFQALLTFAQPGDHLVLTSWEVLSRDYRQLLACLDRLEELELSFEVLELPQLSSDEWRQLFRWLLRNDRLTHPFALPGRKPEGTHSFFTRDSEARKQYRELVGLLRKKQPIRQIAKEKQVPLSTVYHIRQKLERIQLALVLVSCFLLALLSIQLAEGLTSQRWIQLGICLVMTGIILWNVLMDSEEQAAPAKELPKELSKESAKEVSKELSKEPSKELSKENPAPKT